MQYQPPPPGAPPPPHQPNLYPHLGAYPPQTGYAPPPPPVQYAPQPTFWQRNGRWLDVLWMSIAAVCALLYAISTFLDRDSAHVGPKIKSLWLGFGILLILCCLGACVGVLHAATGRARPGVRFMPALMVLAGLLGTATLVLNIVRRYVCKDELISACTLRAPDPALSVYQRDCASRWRYTTIWTYIASVAIGLWAAIFVHFFYQTRKFKKGSSFAARTAALAQSYQMEPRPGAVPPQQQGYAFGAGTGAVVSGNGDAPPPFDHARARETTEKESMPEWIRDEGVEPPARRDNDRREPGGYAV
ncbi:hypothetical protein Q8F55_004076 [Vanrija albida]|uniref:MARVEL domain-containing protein n=1 Tax=Vanrija albida TaxID=181172 RepID=A0ABR3Q6V4_9TREE